MHNGALWRMEKLAAAAALRSDSSTVNSASAPAQSPQMLLAAQACNA